MQKQDKAGAIQRIETERLLLTRPRREDETQLSGLWRNEQVRQYLGGVVNEDIIEKKLAQMQEHWNQAGFGQWAVYEKATGQLAGLCGLHPSSQGVELSYMFYPAFWGKGIATEASRACLAHGFERFDLARVFVVTQEANAASCHLAERLGMRQVDRRWQWQAWQRIYELTREEWRAESGATVRC